MGLWDGERGVVGYGREEWYEVDGSKKGKVVGTNAGGV